MRKLDQTKLLNTLVSIAIVIAMSLALFSTHAPTVNFQGELHVAATHTHDEPSGAYDLVHQSLHEDHSHGFGLADAPITEIARPYRDRPVRGLVAFVGTGPEALIRPPRSLQA